MNAEREQLIFKLAAEVLDRAPNQRPAYLAAACAGDAQLYREVAALLAAEEAAAGDLEKPAVEVAAELLAPEAVTTAARGGFAAETVIGGRYQIIHLIGRGGMGAVYLARDQRLGHRVAIKHSLAGYDRISQKQFEREARTLAHLEHAGLPRVTDYFTDAGGQFLVMQFIAGEDLGHLIKQRGGPFGLAEVLGWAEQLLTILAFLHAQEPPVIHRDIKPQNLKVKENGWLVLLDFGLAKGLPQGSQGLTGSSVYAYTRGYAPPEQINGLRTDERSDLYAAAATLYHLLTGQAPVDASTRTMRLSIEGIDPLIGANEINRAVPEAVAAVLKRAMALDSRQRPESAAGMWKELQEAAARHAAETKPQPPGKKIEVTLKPRPPQPPSPLIFGGRLIDDKPSPGLAGIDEEGSKIGAENLAFRRRLLWGAAGLVVVILLMVLISFRLLTVNRNAPLQDNQNAARETVPPRTIKQDTPQDLVRRGDELVARKQWAQAESVYREAAAATPNNSWYQFKLWRTLDEQTSKYSEKIAIEKQITDQHTLEEIEAQSRRELAQEPNRAFRHLDQGKVLTLQRKYAEAEAEYRKAIELEPNSANAYNNLGVNFEKQNNRLAAENNFRKAIELNPNYAIAYNNLGKALDFQNKYLEAEAAFQQAIKLDANFMGAYNNLGNALRNQGKYKDAETALRKAIELNPNFAGAYSNLGSALYSQKNYVEAEAAYRKAIELDPNSAVAYNNLGLALRSQDRYQEAETAFRKAIELNPNYEHAYYNLGLVLENLHRPEEAQAAFKKASSLNKPSSLNPLFGGK